MSSPLAAAHSDDQGAQGVVPPAARVDPEVPGADGVPDVHRDPDPDLEVPTGNSPTALEGTPNTRGFGDSNTYT